MDNNIKKVHDAVEEVGSGQTNDQEVLFEGLDHVIEILQGMKTRIKKGEIGPLGLLVQEFRNIRPHYKFGGFGPPKGVDQFGPSVTKITILDYKNAGKTLS